MLLIQIKNEDDQENHAKSTHSSEGRGVSHKNGRRECLSDGVTACTAGHWFKTDWLRLKAKASCVSKRFQAVAMHSLPTRVKPYHVLSQGEQERFLVATTLKEGACGNWDDFEHLFFGACTANCWLMLVDVDICIHLLVACLDRMY